MHLPRKLLLQLPQALPGGLHVPQELGYLIVLGFAQLHASHRRGCAEPAGEARDAPGSERQKASDGGAENRGSPGEPFATSPAPRQPRAAATAASRSSAPRPVRGCARRAVRASGLPAPPGSAQPLRRAESAVPARPRRPERRAFPAEQGPGRLRPGDMLCIVPRKSLLRAALAPARAEGAGGAAPGLAGSGQRGPKCRVSPVCRSACAGWSAGSLSCCTAASRCHFQSPFHK